MFHELCICDARILNEGFKPSNHLSHVVRRDVCRHSHSNALQYSTCFIPGLELEGFAFTTSEYDPLQFHFPGEDTARQIWICFPVVLA